MVLKSDAHFNKRGVSPLIATVLLISFAVALGAVVMNWGSNFDLLKEEDVCYDINLKLRNLNGAEVCYSGSGKSRYIHFILDNKGNADVNGLGLWITGEKGTKLLDFNDFSIERGTLLEIRDNTVEYDFNAYGAIKHIQFIPKVKTEDSIEICVRNSVKAEKVEVCES
ncbi:hypothetical protein KY347_04510 [Candidatus Woesearchaeota archaeon]|nr:hypothetical protein [Candidatus Woesearchaeota archaeon]